MTTELEEQFFKVFGIEKIECCKHFKYFDSKCDKLDSTEKCLDCIGTNKVYPKITDRKLLEMICIQGNIDYFMIDNSGNPISVNGLKKSVLHTLTLLSKNHKGLKQQIQQLFKEEE